jgi:FkbM family methyltransferase
MLFNSGKRVKYSKDFWNGSYEIETCRFMERVLENNNICYDIGANLGYHTLIMARKVVGGRVFAFEPLYEAAAILERNLISNCLRNVILVKKAVTSKSGTISLGWNISIDQAAIRWASDSNRLYQPIVCDSTTIDDFIKAGNPPPTFIKIDVEGAEVDVLRGAIETLMQIRPSVMCETHGADNAAKVYEILHGVGYRLFNVSQNVIPVDSINDMPTNMYEGHVYACHAMCVKALQNFLNGYDTE